jgi:hypothetical protein
MKVLSALRAGEDKPAGRLWNPARDWLGRYGPSPSSADIRSYRPEKSAALSL